MLVREPGTIPYNDEPAKDPTRTKVMSFTSCGQRFEIALQVPIYICDALCSEDWDTAFKMVRDRADEIRMDAARAGELLRWQENIQNFARQCVYNQFSKRQVRVGNTEGHAVPLGW